MNEQIKIGYAFFNLRDIVDCVGTSVTLTNGAKLKVTPHQAEHIKLRVKVAADRLLKMDNGKKAFR